MVNFYIYYNIYIYTQTHTYIHTYIYIYIYKITVNPKRYTGIDRYPKYIVPVAKPVRPPDGIDILAYELNSAAKYPFSSCSSNLLSLMLFL